MLYEMNKLFKITGKRLRFLLLLALRSPFDAAMMVVQAGFLQNAFDAVFQNDKSRLTHVCVAFMIASLCLFLYNGTVWSIYAPYITRMEGKLRVKLFAKISALSYQRIEATPRGEWLTRLNTDVQMPFSRPLHLPHAACAVVNIAVSSVILLRLNPATFGWVLLFVLPHIVVSRLLVSRVMPELNKSALEATAQNTGELDALITCADIAALYSGQDYLMKRFEESSLRLMRANMRITMRHALNAAILPLFGMGGYLTLLINAGSWIEAGRLTFGDLTAAFQYRGGVLMGSFMLINSLVSIRASMAGIRRINETMDEKTEEPNG